MVTVFDVNKSWISSSIEPVLLIVPGAVAVTSTENWSGGVTNTEFDVAWTNVTAGSPDTVKPAPAAGVLQLTELGTLDGALTLHV